MTTLRKRVEIAPEGGMFVVKYDFLGRSWAWNICGTRPRADVLGVSCRERTEYTPGEILVSEYGPGFYCYVETPSRLTMPGDLRPCWIPGGTRLYYSPSRHVVAAEVLVVL